MLQRLDGYDAGTVGEKIRLGRKSWLTANKSFGVQTETAHRTGPRYWDSRSSFGWDYIRPQVLRMHFLCLSIDIYNFQ